MFIENKYTRFYYDIVSKARNSNRTKGDIYFESHHVVPKSLGGEDIAANRVLLTAREHYICHWLLLKMVPDYDKPKMYFAFRMMTHAGKKNAGKRYTSKQFEKTKLIYRELISGENHPSFGKKRTQQQCQNISEGAKGRIQTPEHIENRRKSFVGKYVGEKNKNFGKPRSEETKRKISEARRKRVI